MTEIAHNEKLQQLEQRHVQLIDELGSLNTRLEQALNRFVKGKKDEAPCENDEA